MSLYLTTPELAELVGCKPRGLACMKRWLTRNHWPYAVNIAGVPLVAREYFDARMNGTAPRATTRAATDEEEPNFDALAA
ncbi:DUF4224 domain-containing protein [Burkholderia multivorans]